MSPGYCGASCPLIKQNLEVKESRDKEVLLFRLLMSITCHPVTNRKHAIQCTLMYACECVCMCTCVYNYVCKVVCVHMERSTSGMVYVSLKLTVTL